MFNLMSILYGEYSKLELKLARLREILEKKYKNDHNVEYTYIDSSIGDFVPLTLFIMKKMGSSNGKCYIQVILYTPYCNLIALITV